MPSKTQLNPVKPGKTQLNWALRNPIKADETK